MREPYLYELNFYNCFMGVLKCNTETKLVYFKPFFLCFQNGISYQSLLLIDSFSGKLLRSCRGLSVNLTTLFLGRLRPPKRLHILLPE